MALWTLQSHTMLETHNQQCPGVILQHAADDTVSERTIDAYVDDADNYADAPETNGAEEAIGRLQTSAQIWADIVAATGGLMAFHKCNWQILAFTPVGGYVLPQSRNRFSRCDIHLRNHKGMSSKIEYKRHTDANKGLGVTMCPTGDQKPKFMRRLTQMRECVARIATSSLSLTEAYLALKTRVLPMITYSFPVTSFTAKQLKSLAVLIDTAFIPKLGMSSKMKRIAVYAPLELGGANVPSIESIHDQMGIQHFVRSVQWGKELASDIRIVLSRAQLYSGVCTPFLEDCKTTLRHMEEGWLLHLGRDYQR
eukprot:g43.t1 g43   contig1:96394-97323(+)